MEKRIRLDVPRVELVQTQESEAPLLAALRKQVWDATYRGIYPDEMIDEFDLEWHVQQDLRRIRSPQFQVYFICVNEEKAGYLILKQDGGLLLQSLYLLPAFQQKGIGSAVFRLIRQTAAEEKLTSFSCMCQPDNRGAMQFYEKQGGTIRGYDRCEEAWQSSAEFVFPVAEG